MVEDARKALVKERLELELLRRQMERKKKEAEEAELSIPVSIDPFRDEETYKPKHQRFKTQFEIDFFHLFSNLVRATTEDCRARVICEIPYLLNLFKINVEA